MWCTAGFHTRTIAFFIFVNELKNSTKLLDPIMFADDPNFFYTIKNIKVLFGTVNKELRYVNKWLNKESIINKELRRVNATSS